MARALLLGIVALALAGACGQTARDRPESSAVGGAGAGGSAAGATPGGAGAGQIAGSGGAGGALPALSDVERCEQYCETLAYRLPGAFCEDWNGEGWEPEFCGVQLNMSCADYCTKVYETVSPACAATLLPAIRCVAPTYANIAPPRVDPDCWLRDCRDPLYTMTSACYGLREKLAAARARWDASGIVEYQLQFYWGVDVRAQVLVQVGSEPTVTPPDAPAWTVPKLFDEVQRILDGPGTAPAATYHADLGYVVELARQQGCLENPDRVMDVEVTPLP
jgi:hypothetical protein